jgi:hypothetical protein
MFYITYNRPHHIETSVLDSIIAFACYYLDLDADLEVQFESLPEFHYGLCDYEEDEITITISDLLSVEDTVRTIFHELVHVKQYVDGRLESGSPQRWLGEEYTCEYERLPWEVEAFEHEQNMVDIYSESIYYHNR